jgi:molybdopterin/thiamine biosynthesis adenylyltransferase
MESYFKRQIQLWGVEKQRELATKSILIIGSGGLGSSLSLALGSVGIGKVTVVDFDEVAIHNIHRQIAFKLGDEGKKKSDVVKNLVESRSNFTEVESFVESFGEFTKRGNQNFDLIFDATDNLKTRSEIDIYAKANRTPWVYGSVEAFYGHVSLFNKASFSTFQQVDRDLLGVSTPIVMMVASLQANLGLRYLLGESVEMDRLYTISFNDKGVFETRSFKMPVK